MPDPGLPMRKQPPLPRRAARRCGATVYVTLEPCAHQGQTPPCTEVLIAAGVGRVVVGAQDPDPRVNGRGIAMLREAGVEVTISGAAVAERIDPGYFHHRRTGRPLVTLKIAATIDGQVAASDGTSQWITSPAAREDGHRLRAAADAVLVGAGTLREDDPELTVRLKDFTGRQPRAVVVAGTQPLPAERKLYDRDPLIYVPGLLSDPPAGATRASADGSATVDLGMMLDDLGSAVLLICWSRADRRWPPHSWPPVASTDSSSTSEQNSPGDEATACSGPAFRLCRLPVKP